MTLWAIDSNAGFTIVPLTALSDQVWIIYQYFYSGVRGAGRAPLIGWGGAPMGIGDGSFNITCASFPFLRPGTVAYLGGGRQGPAPPCNYKIKRKLRLKSNTWQWQRLRIFLNSLLLQGEKSFSLLKRIIHYTRCTMTESRLNDLALIALHPIRLSELSTEKNHWNVCASKSHKIEA